MVEVNYKVTDAGGLTGNGTFIININGINADPTKPGTTTLSELTASADTNALPSLQEDTALTFTKSELLAAFSDADQDSLDVLGLSASSATDKAAPTKKQSNLRSHRSTMHQKPMAQ